VKSVSYFLADTTQSAVHEYADLMHKGLAPFSSLPGFREFSAYAETLAGATKMRGKPEFGIPGTQPEIIHSLPFCDLVHFACEDASSKPSLLLVAPMSGHYATLLRGTVQDLLPHFDVSVTDWKDARTVPLSAGRFDFHSYIDYCSEFIEQLQPDTAMAICQPGPALAAALALREQNGLANPRSAIFMGSPIDARVSPTAVTKLAQKQSLDWFEKNLIQTVPLTYPGAGRKVYPGRTQLGSFMLMNAETHAKKYREHVENIANRNVAAVDAHNKFYDEYLAVLDLTAEFYLQTVKTVFQDFSLPKGTLMHNGQLVDLGRITKTGVMVVEGEKDDISAVGQNLALLELCSGLQSFEREYELVPGVGHYGIFNGKKFRTQVVGAVSAFAHKMSMHNSGLFMRRERGRAYPASPTHPVGFCCSADQPIRRGLVRTGAQPA
jgi:poly(3-hydroxybutyrate) depolymerase